MGRVKAHYAEEINRPDHEYIEMVTGLIFTGFLFEDTESGAVYTLSEAAALAEEIEKDLAREGGR